MCRNDAHNQFRAIQPLACVGPHRFNLPHEDTWLPTFGLYALPDSNIEEKEALKKHVP